MLYRKKVSFLAHWICVGYDFHARKFQFNACKVGGLVYLVAYRLRANQTKPIENTEKMKTIANNSDNQSARCKVSDPHKLASDLGIHYFGDINLEYGGLFFNSTNWVDHGYADAVRVTDLDSACGFLGGVLIERITILRDQVDSALDCVGHSRGEQATILQEIEACASYGSYDPCNDCWSPTSVIVSTDSESMAYDGWQAEKHIACDDLLGFVHAEWMSDL